MTLTAEDKALIVAICGKIAGHTDAFGGEALDRLFACFGQTKTYFSHFDLSPGSADVKRHGGKVLSAVCEAAKHLDDINQALSKLSDLHAYNLRVDPGNFQLLSHCIQTVLAAHFPADFTPQAQAAMDKFLAAVSSALTCKYR
ncbi:hemoglobin larval subunit alpha-like [Ambystoma mexicanum]|uniref:hemoglobin larval subunit alpha-like n=1 Tax=Ambystoma mexicanum TaxID=8296 RepID=UPI0037E8A3E7